jgi:hypothetical protein
LHAVPDWITVTCAWLKRSSIVDISHIVLNGHGAVQVKNSLRAVNDRFEDAEHQPPPVRVVVAEGDEDVTIKARAPLHPYRLTENTSHAGK